MKKSSGAIITYNKKILMLLRDNNHNIPDPDRWQLIGGQAEESELPIETLTREIKEEVNLQIPEEKIEAIGKIIVPEKQEYFLYWIKLLENQIQDIKLGNEGQKVDLISIESLGKIKLGVNLSNYFQNYHNGIKNLVENEILDKKSLGFDENGIYLIRD